MDFVLSLVQRITQLAHHPTDIIAIKEIFTKRKTPSASPFPFVHSNFTKTNKAFEWNYLPEKKEQLVSLFIKAIYFKENFCFEKLLPAVILGLQKTTYRNINLKI